MQFVVLIFLFTLASCSPISYNSADTRAQLNSAELQKNSDDFGRHGKGSLARKTILK